MATTSAPSSRPSSAHLHLAAAIAAATGGGSGGGAVLAPSQPVELPIAEFSASSAASSAGLAALPISEPLAPDAMRLTRSRRVSLACASGGGGLGLSMAADSGSAASAAASVSSSSLMFGLMLMADSNNSGSIGGGGGSSGGGSSGVGSRRGSLDSSSMGMGTGLPPLTTEAIATRARRRSSLGGGSLIGGSSTGGGGAAGLVAGMAAPSFSASADNLLSGASTAAAASQAASSASHGTHPPPPHAHAHHLIHVHSQPPPTSSAPSTPPLPPTMLSRAGSSFSSSSSSEVNSTAHSAANSRQVSRRNSLNALAPLSVLSPLSSTTGVALFLAAAASASPVAGAAATPATSAAGGMSSSSPATSSPPSPYSHSRSSQRLQAHSPPRTPVSQLRSSLSHSTTTHYNHSKPSYSPSPSPSQSQHSQHSRLSRGMSSWIAAHSPFSPLSRGGGAKNTHADSGATASSASAAAPGGVPRHKRGGFLSHTGSNGSSNGSGSLRPTDFVEKGIHALSEFFHRSPRQRTPPPLQQHQQGVDSGVTCAAGLSSSPLSAPSPLRPLVPFPSSSSSSTSLAAATTATASVFRASFQTDTSATATHENGGAEGPAGSVTTVTTTITTTTMTTDPSAVASSASSPDEEEEQKSGAAASSSSSTAVPLGASSAASATAYTSHELSYFDSLASYGFVDNSSAKWAWLSSYTARFQAQEAAWAQVQERLEAGDAGGLTEKEYKQLTRAGIPAAYRARVWMSWMAPESLQKASDEGLSPEEEYRALVAKADADERAFLEANAAVAAASALASPGAAAAAVSVPAVSPSLVAAAEHLRNINKDVDRTFTSHPLFKDPAGVGVQSLRRMLRAYATRNPVLGYCQSLNYVAGWLLIFYGGDEPTTFWMLCACIEKFFPPDYFSETMLGVVGDVTILLGLVQARLPKIWSHLQKLECTTLLEGILTGWFLCAFIKTTPVETTLRIWDCMFVEGSKVLFRVGLALIASHEAEILASDDFGTCFHFFNTLGQNEYDCDRLMKNAFAIKSIKRGWIETQRKKQHVILSKRHAEMEARRASIDEAHGL